MIKHFYRWLYHYRQRRAAHQRLHGKPRPRRSFKRFSYNVFTRERFDKYDSKLLRMRWARWLIVSLIVLAGAWFLWESVNALGMFQP